MIEDHCKSNTIILNNQTLCNIFQCSTPTGVKYLEKLRKAGLIYIYQRAHYGRVVYIYNSEHSNRVQPKTLRASKLYKQFLRDFEVNSNNTNELDRVGKSNFHLKQQPLKTNELDEIGKNNTGNFSETSNSNNTNELDGVGKNNFHHINNKQETKRKLLHEVVKEVWSDLEIVYKSLDLDGAVGNMLDKCVIQGELLYKDTDDWRKHIRKWLDREVRFKKRDGNLQSGASVLAAKLRRMGVNKDVDMWSAFYAKLEAKKRLL